MFKLPLYLCNDQQNVPGLAFSAGVVATVNVLAYYGYKKFKASKTKGKMREYDVALARYETKIKEINNYLRENQLFYTSSFNNENRILGLVIIEGYYGLADHIYQIEAGLLTYKLP